MAKTEPFEKNIERYEEWFIKNKYVYLSELEALKKVIPPGKKGVEIGIGSGLFAKPLKIKFGVEPSKRMRKKAIERGLIVKEGIAENLPLESSEYDFALMVTTICFVDDIKKSFSEIKRILKPNGYIILGFVDKVSKIGKVYLQNKDKSVFYKDANFYSTGEVLNFLKETGFEADKIYQTVFDLNENINEIQKPKEGYSEGSFIVIRAKKIGGEI